MKSKEKVRKEILKTNNNSLICDTCTMFPPCYNKENKVKEKCYDPIRELYDMEYALKG